MPRFLRSLVVLFTAPVLAQGFNCQFLANHDLHAPYSGMWGYVAPNNKEYALLGTTTGIAVIDCTVGQAPVERAYFPWAASTWREVRTYSTYAYVTTEDAAGFMVIDLTNADAPVNLGIVGAANFGNAHNLGVDMGTGRIYIVGTNNGVAVYDGAANPANPPFIGFAALGGTSNYFHDLTIQNGYGYGAMIYNGIFRIWDVTTWPPTTLSDSLTPSAFTHNIWPTANGNICVTTDERDGSLLRFYDTTNKSAPVPRGQMTMNSASIPHNSYIIGNVAHTAWYTEGYQAVDFSDPTTPIVVASYDTYPGPTGGFSGAWGCFPFLPSGNVYISDRSTGLYVLKPTLTDLAIAHTPLSDTTNEDGPYTVTANVTSSHAIQSATLRYRVNGGLEQSVAMTPTAVPGQYEGGIPGQNAVAGIEYHVDVVDAKAARRSPRIGENRFLVGTRVSRWLDDFEGANTWTTGGTASDWQLGAPRGRAGFSSAMGWQDPLLPTSGNNVRGNDLGGTGFNGAYANSQNSFAQSAAIPTNGVQGLRLRFRRFLSLVSTDTARLLVNGTVIWSTSAALYDTQWQWIEHDISALANPASQVVIRFELVSNTTNAAGGWQIDDVELFTLHDAAPANIYGVGTPGTGAVVPALGISAPALLGTTTNLLGSAMFPSSAAILILNTQPANAPVLGIQLLVDPTGAAMLAELISGSGTASWAFAVPPSPTLDNIYLYAQVAPIDPGSPGGLFSASPGLRFRTCISAP
ncbi:MAG TPA: choice-of-anchor B family protein [Planctomycetota bacterium]|nr:choice-of-anchor B family protein [Planctomycetota bacterium]